MNMRASFLTMRHKEAGFTLVEILVVLAVTGLITAGALNFMISQNRSYSIKEDVQEMEQNARAAMDYLVSELQQAEQISNVDPAGNRIDLSYSGINPVRYGFVAGTYSDDELKSSAIRNMGDPTTFNPTSPQPTWPIAAFITQDSDGDTVPDAPLFKYDPTVNPRVITVTIIARTRKQDPNYTSNNGYRQIVLTRRVVLKNKKNINM